MTEPVTPGPAIAVTIDLTRIGVGYEGKTVEDLIVESAGYRLYALVEEEAKRDLRTRVNRIRDEEIRARVAPIIEQALTEGFQPCDPFGDPQGPPTTLRGLITQAVQDSLKATRSGSYGAQQNIVQKFIADEVQRAFTAELKKALDEAKGEVISAVKERGAEVLAETIARLGGVKP